ncbi:MAG TPA: ATP-binding cassette domain-containing protein [Bacillota bacterium]|jgi:ABC-type lipoprotein export system ATPase subunit
MLQELSILPGTTKDGRRENFSRLDLRVGEIVSIVGPTGSGKTAFITDIELLAQKDTATGRQVLIDGGVPDEDWRQDPARKPVAMITQNTKCFTDLTVKDFLATHARARRLPLDGLIDETIDLANQFTGEKIGPMMRITTLSGGQTRSLMIADALHICAAPVILLDEIENAGIFKQEVVDTVRRANKMIVFVTHDPVIAILTHKRIVFANGGVVKILERDDAERPAAETLISLDRRLIAAREKLRAGLSLCNEVI